ncbi:MAG TPA: 6-phosphogluconolactonase [Stellaceae bacterium]|nr:6-phosphogluconolactonase [Stellaceae bacterium]
MNRAERNLVVLDDAAAVAERAAAWLAERVGAAAGSAPAVCLSGGSTPRRLYRRLAEPPFRAMLPWHSIHWFWGDERFVPPDDPRSNYRMAREALFDAAPVPPGNIHPVPTVGRKPEDAAADYERLLLAVRRDMRRDGAPLFDATLLGLGADGHTASLFPGSPALAERRRLVVAVVGAQPEARITLTFPALDSSGEVAFLVTGSDKRPILARLLAGGAALPAACVAPQGACRWFVDRSAAPEGEGG